MQRRSSGRCARGLAFASCALALLACERATHTVGRIEAESGVDRGSAAPAAGNAGTPAAAGGAGSGEGASGAPATNVDPAPSAAPDFTCGSSPVPAQRKRLELYLIVDSNINLPFLNINPWSTLLAGISSYVDTDIAAGTAIAVKYFGFTCDANSYATPAVAMQPLPDNSRAVQDSLRTVVPINSSPMLPALEGALRYSKSRANAYTDTKQAVVLVTDGFFDLACGSDQQSLENAAAAGVRTPAVPSYVIVLDSPDLISFLSPLTRLDPLDGIARAGTTGHARRIDAQDASSAFVQAMHEVQLEAESCEYAVPQALRDDPDRLSLGVETELGVPLAALPQLPAAADCGEGYYLDANAQWLSLCPSVCDEVKQSRSSLLWFTDC